jgi:hypothetical protein
MTTNQHLVLFSYFSRYWPSPLLKTSNPAQWTWTFVENTIRGRFTGEDHEDGPSHQSLLQIGEARRMALLIIPFLLAFRDS